MIEGVYTEACEECGKILIDGERHAARSDCGLSTAPKVIASREEREAQKARVEVVHFNDFGTDEPQPLCEKEKHWGNTCTNIAETTCVKCLEELASLGAQARQALEKARPAGPLSFLETSDPQGQAFQHDVTASLSVSEDGDIAIRIAGEPGAATLYIDRETLLFEEIKKAVTLGALDEAQLRAVRAECTRRIVDMVTRRADLAREAQP